MAEPTTWVDVEAAARAYVRQALPAVAGRVFFGFTNDAALPQVRLARIGGTDFEALIQFDVWAATKAQAAATTAALCTAVDALARFAYEGTILHGADVTQGPSWQPDEEGDMPRYVVTILFSATAGA